jgi:voltage-gated potassium channel
MLAGSLLFVAAAILHFIEGPGRPQEFGSIPRALWWSAVTLTTIGYGDVFPVTVMGKICAAITAVLGIAVVALPTGIFAAAISDELKDRETRKLKRAKP